MLHIAEAVIQELGNCQHYIPINRAAGTHELKSIEHCVADFIVDGCRYSLHTATAC